ncbi:hypothetical protein E5082_28650 [Streptomyces griseoluteus]|uniref:Uncharacterized protein n=1 Tax=Streptomyces griseoluteus TaxID=29306 RepID=A0A4Z1D3H9_STRGP|nr:hypothetical protein [Streptomyces griseoluteus]TGN76167.1 hypothetical protein E5082_28650 [Streptomyces griseoluteus]GHE92947.1 hypothetical protein GCM10017776_06780 [Streptomyces griseoluteus]
MANLTPPPARAELEPRLTLRVYRVIGNGRITDDTGTRQVPPCDEPLATGTWPPCQCPRHREAS